MSLEATWELRANGMSPRSFCVWQAFMHPGADSPSGGGGGAATNPFDSVPSVGHSSSSGNDGNGLKAHGLIFGTEQGTLHYRAYAPTSKKAVSSLRAPSPPANRSLLHLSPGGASSAGGNAASAGGGGGGKSSARRSQPPLGVTATGRPPANLPRMYLPVDSGATLPGPIVGIVHDTTTASMTPAPAAGTSSLVAPLPPSFLVMVDDNKGDHVNSSTPGAYLPILITLQHGTFRKLALPGASNRRVTSAIFSPQTGFLLAAGRTLTQVFPEAYHGALQDDGSGSTVSSLLRGGTQRKKKGRSRPDTTPKGQKWDFTNVVLPSPGARGGQTALELTAGGRVAVITVGHVVYAVAGKLKVEPNPNTDDDADRGAGGGSDGARAKIKSSSPDCVKLLSFGQSSQVHPVILLDLPRLSLSTSQKARHGQSSASGGTAENEEWSTVFCANGRECAVVDLQYDNSPHQHYGPSGPLLECSKPRNGMVTVASPILAASLAGSYWIAILTSDGLVSIRSPSCLAISLRTVEVGTRPNDFFGLKSMWFGGHGETTTGTGTSPMAGGSSFANPFSSDSAPVAPGAIQNQMDSSFVTISYSCQAKILKALPDTPQDLADRLMRHAIDAFGANGFPRSELADAVQASFTATSYVGPEPTPQSRELLRQYLQAILGLTEWEGRDNGNGSWPIAVSGASSFGSRTIEASFSAQRPYTGQSGNSGGGNSSVELTQTVVSAATATSLVTGSALLCLVCTQLASSKPTLANRAAQKCAEKVGTIVLDDPDNDGTEHLPPSAVEVCGLVADRLLREASQSFSLLGSSNSQVSSMDLIEAAVWLLRASGQHERAIQVLFERLPQRQKTAGSSASGGMSSWSPIKYASYTATHLSELWSTGKESACALVLQSSATHRLLQENPRLGLGVFTSLLPQTAEQWNAMLAKDDPLAHPTYPAQVVKLLQTIQPIIPYDQKESELAKGAVEKDSNIVLPLESGRALAVSYLESAIGISSNRLDDDDDQEAFNRLAPDPEMEDQIAKFHDELCYLLLEGVIAERGDDNTDETDTVLGTLYRRKLRAFLRWPLTKIRSERLLSALPKSFLQEQALVLGRMGRHEDALRILYCECKSLDLALDYCDRRHERLQARRERGRARAASSSGGWMDDDRDAAASKSVDDTCAYLPLVKVALQSDSDSKRGTSAAIQVLALRRGSIDRAAALRLLPKNVPVSAVARPFLIPALVDSESQVRRLTVVSSLLRSKYVTLKQQLTDAQLKAQAKLHVVPQLRNLNLGDPIHSTKPIKARPSTSASSTFPDVTIVKHFFPRHVVIQAIVANNAHVDGRALGNVAFVVAESSEEAIQPALRVPIKVLPFKASGATWCVLSALPQRMEGTAILTCELRYTVLAVDATTGAPLSFGVGNSGSSNGRTFVEELQDLEVYSSHFS